MNNKERIAKMKPQEYKQIFGIEKWVFDRLLRVLEITKAFEKAQSSSKGRKSKLEVIDMLVIALTYWREYRTVRHIAFNSDNEISKSTVSRSIEWVETTLINSGICNLSSKGELRDNLSNLKILAIDVTEQEIERPKKTKVMVFGKKEEACNQNSNNYRC